MMLGNTATEYLLEERQSRLDGDSDGSVLRILAFADGFSATYEIYLGEASNAFQEGGVASLKAVDEAKLNELDGGAIGPFVELGSRRALRQLFADARPHVVIFLRFGGRHAREVMSLATEYKSRTIYILDDALFDVPVRIGIEKYRFRRNPYRLMSMEYLLTNVDLVYTATEALAENIRDKNLAIKRLEVCECINFAKSRQGRPARNGDTETPFRIGFAGSSTHGIDLDLLCDGILAATRVFPNLTFEILGKIALPPAFGKFGDRIQTLSKTDSYKDYRKTLLKRKWDLGRTPLHRRRRVRHGAEPGSRAALALLMTNMLYHVATETRCFND